MKWILIITSIFITSPNTGEEVLTSVTHKTFSGFQARTVCTQRARQLRRESTDRHVVFANCVAVAKGAPR